MMGKTYNVLFLCTGNSARSIFAEALMNQLGGGIFQAFSAGSHPASAPHPLTLKVLNSQGIDTSYLSSKNLLQYQHVDSPKMDFIFTLCDKMAGEGCPVFPGKPLTAHWGFKDPAQVEGGPEAMYQAFVEVEKQIAARIRLFLSLPFEKLDRLSLQRQLEELGQ
ncbi:MULTISPECIES: arsenate reductase ArsC [Serratia]|uniref:arsenate reductase ArsC n=1 Tax=Serratia TaxID=613 RepID=UPI00066E9DEE|nr:MULTISPECIES: arsenate reductase ArsC [Serratia]MBN5198699.1 arsenate reductase ArsC [Serratia marcescens]HEJ7948249.1 arsenate reductase ArsC [Serratia liquefaciens]